MEIIRILIIVWMYFPSNSHESNESLQGTIARRGTNEFIIDKDGIEWMLDDRGRVYKSGQAIIPTSLIESLLYWDNRVYGSVTIMTLTTWWTYANGSLKLLTNAALKDQLNQALKSTPASSTVKSNSQATTTTKTPTDPTTITPTDPTTTTTTTTNNQAIISIDQTTTTVQSATTGPIATRISEITSTIQTIIRGESASTYFISPSCNDLRYLGAFCNISAKTCDTFKPCKNSGSCTHDPSRPHGYFCTCAPGYSGTNCDFDIRLCKPNTCLQRGICKELNSTTFHCNCTQGYTGIHCEHLIDYCKNVTCLNKGICRSLFLGYKCECLFGTSGSHCEDKTTTLHIRQYISKGFAYIAIIILVSTAAFIIVLDILKYGFGIDLVRKERERIRRERAVVKRNNYKKRNL